MPTHRQATSIEAGWGNPKLLLVVAGTSNQVVPGLNLSLGRSSGRRRTLQMPPAAAVAVMATPGTLHTATAPAPGSDHSRTASWAGVRTAAKPTAASVIMGVIPDTARGSHPSRQSRTGSNARLHDGAAQYSTLPISSPRDDDGLDADALALGPRSRRSSSVESALSFASEDFAHATVTMGQGCCRGYSVRMLFLMGCAMIEYIAQTVILLLGPMIALHFYPTTSYPRIGFYTALLTGSGYVGNALSCRLWINMARSLKSAKGVILWGLAIQGTGFFSLLLCQSLLAMTIVRFAMGLFSGVIPVALIEIDNICGNRQTRLAMATKYLGILIGAGGTLLLIGVGHKIFKLSSVERDETALFLYPLCSVSIISWIAVVITLIGLRMSSQTSYAPLMGDEDGKYKPQRRGTLDDTSTSSGSSPASSLELVKSAFEETFRRTRNPLKELLQAPRPHFRMIRSIIPHYYHGYSSNGNVVIWDFLGQIKMDKLASGGFTKVDIRSHYQFFIQFALDKLTKSSSQKIVYVVDLEGLTLMDADDRVVESAGAIISDLQKSFPDKLSQVAVINSPVWFSQVMAALKSQIAKKTLDKIVFCRPEATAEELLEIVGVDSLPKKYGGRNGVEFGRSSQERALEDHLRQTTGILEQTKEIIARENARQTRKESLAEDESDEEAFFDCSEYGLQDDDEEDISIVIHSQANPSSELVARASASPPKPQRSGHADKKVHDHDMSPGNRKNQVPGSDDVQNELGITQEPHACLILAVFFLWSLVQISFDELVPLWFFRRDGKAGGAVHPANSSESTISLVTMHVCTGIGAMAFAFLCFQVFVCRSSSLMTPLATLRVGLLFQVPLIGCFPILDMLHIDTQAFSSALVVAVILLKHLTSAIALHGLMTLLDNSIAVDRRLVVHRTTHFVWYVGSMLSSGAPALFALLGYFSKPFPFDQSLMYFIQSLALVFLFLFSFLIPSRLNFPMLFAMNKR